jgi:hypothetical protein
VIELRARDHALISFQDKDAFLKNAMHQSRKLNIEPPAQITSLRELIKEEEVKGRTESLQFEMEFVAENSKPIIGLRDEERKT